MMHISERQQNTETMYGACGSLLGLYGPRLEEARRAARLAVLRCQPSERGRLADAVEANLRSRKSCPFAAAERRYSLRVSAYAFRQAKQAYCRAMLESLLEQAG